MHQKTGSLHATLKNGPETTLAKQIQEVQARLKRLEDDHQVFDHKGEHAGHRLKLPMPKHRKSDGRLVELSRTSTRLEDVFIDPFTDIILQPLSIFGVISNLHFVLPNQGNANPPAVQDVDVPVPNEAVLVLPVLQGWNLLYGDLQNQGSIANINDSHHVAQAYVNVYVVNQAPGTATIRASMALGDQGLDDQWAGQVWVTVLLLGPTPPDIDRIFPPRPWPFLASRKPKRKAR